MAYQVSSIQTHSRFGVTAHHAMFNQDGGSDKLLIILPGRGYTTEHPVLYYLRNAALALGCDVLSVQYGFQAAQIDLTPENTPFVQDDVTAATQPILARGYRHVCIAGKSLGTPLAAELARTISGARVSLILLTPIGGATQGLDGIPSLCVIGTADALYTPELVQDEPHLTWRVFEGLNHALEFRGDWRASLAVLPEVIAACEAFLQRP